MSENEKSSPDLASLAGRIQNVTLADLDGPGDLSRHFSIDKVSQLLDWAHSLAGSVLTQAPDKVAAVADLPDGALADLIRQHAVALTEVVNTAQARGLDVAITWAPIDVSHFGAPEVREWRRMLSVVITRVEAL